MMKSLPKQLLVYGGALLAIAACCELPSYTPAFWNDDGTVRRSNNCYNYANNKRTNTFAQPGRAAGARAAYPRCDLVRAAAIADGLSELSDSGS